MPKPKRKETASASRQIKVTVPSGHWPAVREAMEIDGSTKISQFALAAIMQRTRRILAQKELEAKSPRP